MRFATRSVVIALEDSTAINQIRDLLFNRNYSLIIEKSVFKCMMKVQDQERHFLIVYMDETKNNFLDLIGILKKSDLDCQL